MQLTESIQILKGNKYYKECQKLTFLSKNLYNSALYAIRQEYIKNKKYLNYYAVNNKFVKQKQQDYYALPTKVSQQTLKLVQQNFKSFFALLKAKQGKVKLPKYLKKNGNQVVIYTIQAISKKLLKKNIIKLSGTNIQLKIRNSIKNINQVRIIKCQTENKFKIQIVYTVIQKQLKQNNNRYASIDLGVNNLATISSNVIKPIIINGRPLKSINQYFNKKKAQLNSKNLISTNKYKTLSRIHHNKINDYLHKASKHIVNHLVSNNINTLVIGKNIGWKQETDMRKKDNQNFVAIPHARFIQMLQYKCQLEGITVILNEQSYTSKCSFIDNQQICKHNKYIGRRIKRGLFKTANKKFINADLNGSLNILKKAIGEFQYSIEACSTPKIIYLS